MIMEFSVCVGVCMWRIFWVLIFRFTDSRTRFFLDNNLAYDATISGIRRCRILALEAVVVAQGHVLLRGKDLVLFQVLHVVGIGQAAYVVIWWICVRKREGGNCLN